jgi:ribosome biogenesis GTPase
VVCGDIVNLRLVGHEGVIDSIAPRTSLLYRADAWRIKPIAANVTQVGVVVAARPSFSLELAERCLLAAEAEAIAAFVVLNKIDLPEHAAARERLERIVRLGYPLVEVSAKADASPLSAQLAGHTRLLIGQSRMGKSTLVNALVPDAATATAEYSEALDSGRHTTTYTRLYRIDANSALIDSPGLQEFACTISTATPSNGPLWTSGRIWEPAGFGIANMPASRAARSAKPSRRAGSTPNGWRFSGACAPQALRTRIAYKGDIRTAGGYR